MEVWAWANYHIQLKVPYTGGVLLQQWLGTIQSLGSITGQLQLNTHTLEGDVVLCSCVSISSKRTLIVNFKNIELTSFLRGWGGVGWGALFLT